jgi:hypothetical protein
MADFREQVVERLGMELRKNQTEWTDDDVLRRLESTQAAWRNLLEREAQLEGRFKALSKIAGPEATQEAMDATPSDDKMAMLRWLDPEGDDFMGSGMGLKDYLVKRRIEDYNTNISSQMRDEQSRRLDLIIRLSVAFKHVRSEDLHGTSSLESAIEDIIKGMKADDFDQRIEWMLERRWIVAKNCGLPRLPSVESSQARSKPLPKTAPGTTPGKICWRRSPAWSSPATVRMSRSG